MKWKIIGSKMLDISNDHSLTPEIVNVEMEALCGKKFNELKYEDIFVGLPVIYRSPKLCTLADQDYNGDDLNELLGLIKQFNKSPSAVDWVRNIKFYDCFCYDYFCGEVVYKSDECEMEHNCVIKYQNEMFSKPILISNNFHYIHVDKSKI